MRKGKPRMKKLGLLLVLVVWVTGCGDSLDDVGVPAADPAPATASLEGTITSAANMAVDGDTNDPFSPWIPNDPGTPGGVPQQLVAPVSLGGFASASATGVQGDRFESQPDPSDVYRVTLVAGQSVLLRISDHPGGAAASPNLDLVLLAEGTTTEVEASRGTAATESVTVGADGRYDLKVEAVAGASNYILTIGTSGTTAAEFVPGEVLVRFAADPGAVPGRRAARTGLRVLAGEEGRIMRLALPREPLAREAALGTLGVVAAAGGAAPGDEEAELRRQTLLAVEALRARPDVLSADPNYIHQPTAVPNDTHYRRQWHYDLINLPQAWDLETGSSNPVTVAVVDTGVLLDHPDLVDKLVPGYDFIADPLRAGDGNGIDPDPNDPGDSQTPGSSSFHGTHVAGTVAAATDNGSGVAGTSWGASLMPIRVLGQGGGTSFDIIQGVRYAAGLANDSGTVPSSPADIINLSLGCSGCFSASEAAAYAAVRAAGTVLVAAAGNQNSSVPSYPASYDGVISVAAVDRFKQRTPYSNFGAAVDIAAPGGDTSRDADADGFVDGVLSTVGTDGGGGLQFVYGFYQGTSMASPHVAGVIALMQASNPAFVTPDRVDALLQTNALTEDLGAAGRDNVYGYGLIDAYRAVVAARSGVVPTTLSADPGSLAIGATGATAQDPLFLDLIVNGAGSVVIVSVSTLAPWLQVARVSADDAFHYAVSVDRTGLADGTYPASITVDYTADGVPTSIRVPVIMRVGSATLANGDTGYTYMLLVDPSTNQSVHTVHTRNRDGLYSFRFEDVAPGSYYIIVGTDSDNDFFICDDGESCGGYPTLGQLQPIQVLAGDERQVERFVTAFQVALDGAGATPGTAQAPSAGYRRSADRAASGDGVAR